MSLDGRRRNPGESRIILLQRPGTIYSSGRSCHTVDAVRNIRRNWQRYCRQPVRYPGALHSCVVAGPRRSAAQLVSLSVRPSVQSEDFWKRTIKLISFHQIRCLRNSRRHNKHFERGRAQPGDKSGGGGGSGEVRNLRTNLETRATYPDKKWSMGIKLYLYILYILRYYIPSP